MDAIVSPTRASIRARIKPASFDERLVYALRGPIPRSCPIRRQRSRNSKKDKIFPEELRGLVVLRSSLIKEARARKRQSYTPHSRIEIVERILIEALSNRNLCPESTAWLEYWSNWKFTARGHEYDRC